MASLGGSWQEWQRGSAWGLVSYGGLWLGRLGLALQGASRFLRNGAAGEAGQVPERHVRVSKGTAGGSGSVVESRDAEGQGMAGMVRRGRAGIGKPRFLRAWQARLVREMRGMAGLG